MDNNTVSLFYYIRDAMLCIGFLIGIGVGVLLIVRKRTQAGILAVAGFALFGVEPIADLVIFRMIETQPAAQTWSQTTYNTLDATYACLSSIAFFIGSILLIATLFNSAQAKGEIPETPPEETGANNR